MTSRPVTLSIIAFILVPVLLQQIKEVKKDVAWVYYLHKTYYIIYVEHVLLAT